MMNKHHSKTRHKIYLQTQKAKLNPQTIKSTNTNQPWRDAFYFIFILSLLHNYFIEM